MDTLAGYGSGSESDSLPPPSMAVQAAPKVLTNGLALDESRVVSVEQTRDLAALSKRSLYYNMSYDDMNAPEVGPTARPEVTPVPMLPISTKNHRTGIVQVTHMNPSVFEEQYNRFDTMGTAIAPQGQGTVSLGYVPTKPGIEGALPQAKRRKTAAEKKLEKQQEEELAREAQALAEMGMPFRLKTEGHSWMDRAKWALSGPPKEAGEAGAGGDGEGGAGEGGVEAREDDKVTVSATGEKSFFHLKSRKDYQGRDWVEPPASLKKEDLSCYLPKKVIREYAGHAKGVASIELIPNTGHLLLSAGMDGKVKIWDTEGAHGFKCVRTYAGHDKGVRGVHFSNDGRRFLSTAFDKTIRLWDTESGKCISTFGKDIGKMFFCGKMHPDDDKQNVLMAGCQDRKVYQWDMNTGEIVQQYDQHQAAVNTVTFVDDNRRFVTTSDDKCIRVWDFGIPFSIKYIADPSMQSMPYVSKRPDDKYVLMQSLSNEVMAYGAKDRFTRFKKKTFSGHLTAGYACQVSSSPDGKFVSSGDGEGRVFFWDWKNCKIARTIKAHQGVCIGVTWHPMYTSRVFTCGWDGAIKMWD